MAVVMALLLKYFIVEAYKIPTGSMQPTLIGDSDSGIKDRILVDKLSYVFRHPKRWEVAVFRYPLNQAQNFVKRIVGVGPEELRIRHGDIWTRSNASEEWSIARRPPGVMETVWKRLDLQDPEGTSWKIQEARGEWEPAGRTIRARGDGRASFRGPASVVDLYLDGYPERLIPFMPDQHRKSGANTVGDLRVTGTVAALPGTETVLIELGEGDRRYRFRIPGPAADEAARPEIEVENLGTWDAAGGAREAAKAYRLPSGQAVAFAAQNLDDRLELEIAGEAVCELEVEPTADQRSGVFLEVVGEGADFGDLMVSRDIYYLDDGLSEVTIPDGEYFMLGDNTQDSSDGREWRYRRYRLPEGGGDDGSAPRILRGNARGNENPRTVGYGRPEGPLLVFEDEWGETHWFPSGVLESLPPEAAPFVPRHMIQGKALAVFWPLNPRLSIYRLNWIR